MLTKLRKFKLGRKGFTLVELLVVIAILGILAAIVIPKLSNQSGAARVAQVKADLKTLDETVQIYATQNGGSITALASLAPSYINAVPSGPVGNTVGSGGNFSNYSYVGGRAVAVMANGSYTVENMSGW